MRQFFACIFFLLFASVSYGQNMVINSDLETYGTCPSYFGCLTPQYLPNWNWGTWGSADYYHICAPDPVASVPTHVNGLGYQMPHSGLAYGGIILFDSSSAYKEYALGTLTPLTPGLFYEVTIHLSAANFTMYAVQNIGMYFVQNGLAGTNTLNNLAIVPQANFSTGSPLTDTANWITLIDTFFADSAYSSFLLGNFEVNPIHTFLGYISLSSWDQAYYFFDDILVQPITTAPLSATIVSTNIACYGANTGQAYAWPLGGAYPYSYLWQPGGVTTQTITNLSPGAYTCTITDANNSVVTQTVTITQPPSPVTAAATVLANACNGTNGSAIVTASGGVSPYSYTWAPVGGSGTTANNIPAGTYTVTVTDANGCSTNDVVVVNLSTPINLSITAVNVDCYSQSTGLAVANVSGGLPPYTYLWSNGQTTQIATNLSAGTYSVTVTDANGCAVTTSVTITQPPPFNVSAVASTINCFGQPTIATVNVSGGQSPYTYLWSNGQTTQTATSLTAGSYTVTVTDANFCTATATVTITQPPQLNLTTTSVNNALCGQPTGSATVSASGGTPGYTYSWLPTGGNGTSATNLGAGSYTVTATDTKGCTDTVHIAITTSTALTVFFSASANVNCFGQSTGSATTTVTGGTGPYTYNWNNGNTTPTINNVPSGIYTVTVTDQNGCAGTASINITQPPQLLASASGSNINCSGQSTGSATTSVSGGTSPYTYLWSNGSTTASINNVTAGSYTVTVTDANGCTDTAQATITQNSPLNIAVSSANATCSQNNGWTTATVTGGIPPYSYSWSNGQITQTTSNLGAGVYSVSVTDALGCTGSATVSITQSANLTVNTIHTNISCHSLNNGSTTVSVSTGTPPYTYSWSNGGTTNTISNLSAGTYTITVTDAINCQGTTTVTITEPAVLNASIPSSSDVLCHGGATGSAEVAVTGGTTPYNYLWSNSSITAMQNTLTAGSYYVIVTDSNGCTDSASIVIAEPTALVITAQALTASCVGEAQGSAEVTASGGVIPYTYSWNSNPVQTTGTATNLPPGGYWVKVTDNNGCTQTASVAITPHSLPIVDAGDDTVFCPGKDILVLHATGADSYLWSPAAGLSCTACADPVASPTITTTYTVAGTDANGCQASDDVIVAVIEKQPTSVGADKHICTGESTQLFAEGGVEYNWSPATAMNDHTIFNPTVAPDQTTVYTVTIRQNDCYTDTLSQVVTVHTMPQVDLGPDIKAMSGASIDLHADTSNAISITWTPPFNLSCDDCADPTAFIEKDIRYVATVANGGCTAVDDINIRTSCAESDVFLPNSFTPNLDGNNDIFYPQSGISMMISYMTIYDRWGEKIFEQRNFVANDPLFGWDGTYKGKMLEPNIYVYYVQFLCGNGQRILLKGDIAIVK